MGCPQFTETQAALTLLGSCQSQGHRRPQMLLTGQAGSQTQITPEAHQELGSLSFLIPPAPAFGALPVSQPWELQVGHSGPQFPHLYAGGGSHLFGGQERVHGPDVGGGINGPGASLPPPVSLSVCLSLCLCLPLCLFLCISPPLSLSLLISLSLSLSFCVSLCLLTLYFSFSVSVSPCLSLSFHIFCLPLSIHLFPGWTRPPL